MSYPNDLKNNKLITDAIPFQKDIKDAYFRLSKVWHPDLHLSSEDESSSKKAESKFREISDAYEILSDPKKRKIYDVQVIRFLIICFIRFYYF